MNGCWCVAKDMSIAVYFDMSKSGRRREISKNLLCEENERVKRMENGRKIRGREDEVKREEGRKDKVNP